MSPKTLGIIIVIVAFSAVYTFLVHVLLINNLGTRVNKTRALSISDQFHGVLQDIYQLHEMLAADDMEFQKEINKGVVDVG